MGVGLKSHRDPTTRARDRPLPPRPGMGKAAQGEAGMVASPSRVFRWSLECLLALPAGGNRPRPPQVATPGARGGGAGGPAGAKEGGTVSTSGAGWIHGLVATSRPFGGCIGRRHPVGGAATDRLLLSEWPCGLGVAVVARWARRLVRGPSFWVCAGGSRCRRCFGLDWLRYRGTLEAKLVAYRNKCR